VAVFWGLESSHLQIVVAQQGGQVASQIETGRDAIKQVFWGDRNHIKAD
jgi:hypothetical protein